MMKTLRQLILEEKCPYCNDPHAYVGMSEVECPNPRCKAFSQRQADDVAPAAPKPQGGGLPHWGLGGSRKPARQDFARPDPFLDSVWEASRHLRNITRDNLDDYNARNHDPNDPDDDPVTMADLADSQGELAVDAIGRAIVVAPTNAARGRLQGLAKQLEHLPWENMSDEAIEEAPADLESALAGALEDAGYEMDDEGFNE